MVTSDWIGLAVAIGTISLAVVAFISIRRARDTQKREYRQRLLSKIIEWATQILICGRDIDAEKFTRAFTQRAELIEFRQRLNIITWRGVYIRNVAGDIDQQIYRSILTAITRINQHIKVLDLCWYGKLKDNAAIGRHRDRLDNCAKLIIEIAVKLLSNNSTSSP
jgi:hypothetical protein